MTKADEIEALRSELAQLKASTAHRLREQQETIDKLRSDYEALEKCMHDHVLRVKEIEFCLDMHAVDP